MGGVGEGVGVGVEAEEALLLGLVLGLVEAPVGELVEELLEGGALGELCREEEFCSELEPELTAAAPAVR